MSNRQNLRRQSQSKMPATLAELKSLVTVPANTITDDDVNALLLVETELYAAAAALCRRIGSFYASQFDVTSGRQKAMLSQRHTQFMNLAIQFDKRGSKRVAAGTVTGTDSADAFSSTQFEPDRGG